MSEVIRKLLGKTVVVSLRLAGTIPVKGILSSADDRLLVVDQIKGTRCHSVHIPLESVLFFVEDHEEHP